MIRKRIRFLLKELRLKQIFPVFSRKQILLRNHLEKYVN